MLFNIYYQYLVNMMILKVIHTQQTDSAVKVHSIHFSKKNVRQCDFSQTLLN